MHGSTRRFARRVAIVTSVADGIVAPSVDLADYPGAAG
jgi:hypothetical protein